MRRRRTRSTRSISLRRKPASSMPAGGGLWGRRGDSVDPEGRVYIGTGDARFDTLSKSLGNGIVARQASTRTSNCSSSTSSRRRTRTGCSGATSTSTSRRWSFDYKGTKFLVGTSKECRLWLLDRDNLGGDDHRTPLYTSTLLCNDIQAFDAKGIWGSLATWQDAAGTQLGARAVLGPGQQGVSMRRSNTAARRSAASRR